MKVLDFSPHSRDQEALDAFHFKREIAEDTYVWDAYQEDDSNGHIDWDGGVLKILKKRVHDGVAFLAVRSESIEIWWQKEVESIPTMVAEAELIGQVWDGEWRDRTFNFDSANLTQVEGSHYRAFKVEDIPALNIVDATWGLDVWWEAGTVKFAFYADVPGKLLQLQWRARVMDAALAWTDDSDPENPITHKGLKFSAKDYTNYTEKIEEESLGTSTDGNYSGVLLNYPIDKVEKPTENGKQPTSWTLNKDTGAYVVQFDRTIPELWDYEQEPPVMLTPEYQDTSEYSVSVNYTYYPNTVDHTSGTDAEAGWAWHRWIFEPQGFQCPAADSKTPAERFAESVGLYVDPYLSVDEQPTYIDVFCDGYYIHILTAGSDELLTLYTDTARGQFRASLYSGADSFFANENAPIWTLLENTPNRVVFSLVNNWYNVGHTLIDTDSDSLKILLYFYSDRLFVDVKWTTSGDVVLDDSSYVNAIAGIDMTGTGDIWAASEIAGSEVYSTGDKSGTYIGTLNRDLNAIMMDTYTSRETDFRRRIHSSSYFSVGWNNGTIPAGVHQVTTWVMFDSLKRETTVTEDGVYDSGTEYVPGDIVSYDGSNWECIQTGTGKTPDQQPAYWRNVKLYLMADRLTLGDQYKATG